MANLAVFCGANAGHPDRRYVDLAAAVGRAIAAAGHGVVYGGGRVGLMGAVADGALAASGRVYGYLPAALADRELEHTGITEMHVVGTMHERKAAMCDRADGFIVLPGGFGTLDEVMEILTWNQIGIIAKPVAFVDDGDYYGPLFDFFDAAVESGLVKQAHRAMARRVGDVVLAVEIASGPAPASPSKWTDPGVR
mgnify:CR=1 FL=1